jgi:hypothetical protein
MFSPKNDKICRRKRVGSTPQKKEKITHCPKPYITDSVHARVERSFRV